MAGAASLARMTAIETDELTRRFGAAIAVDGVSLSVPEGSVFGFLGPNGAGKTTTIRMLLGLIRPHGGAVRLNGHALGRARAAALSGVGAIVETPALYPNLTGREIMRSGARLIGAPLEAVDPLLDQLDLTAAADRPCGKYSLGMRQRLALARALLGRPKLLILDEPTNGLDPAGIAAMRETIKTLPERVGATVFLSSHLLSEIEQTADHCALIDHGRLIYQGRMADLKAQAPERLVFDSPDPAGLQTALSARGFEAVLEDGTVCVEVELDALARAELIAGLIAAGAAVSGLRSERATLESLFLKLTGGPG